MRKALANFVCAKYSTGSACATKVYEFAEFPCIGDTPCLLGRKRQPEGCQVVRNDELQKDCHVSVEHVWANSNYPFNPHSTYVTVGKGVFAVHQYFFSDENHICLSLGLLSNMRLRVIFGIHSRCVVQMAPA